MPLPKHVRANGNQRNLPTQPIMTTATSAGGESPRMKTEEVGMPIGAEATGFVKSAMNSSLLLAIAASFAAAP